MSRPRPGSPTAPTRRAGGQRTVSEPGISIVVALQEVVLQAQLATPRVPVKPGPKSTGPMPKKRTRVCDEVAAHAGSSARARMGDARTPSTIAAHATRPRKLSASGYTVGHSKGRQPKGHEQPCRHLVPDATPAAPPTPPPPGAPWGRPLRGLHLRLLDCREMTGLDPAVDRLLEVAVARAFGGT